MVLKADVLAAALDSVAAKDPKPRPMLALTPRGKPLTQSRVRELVAGEGVILLCGRFEGFDESKASKAARRADELHRRQYQLASRRAGPGRRRPKAPRPAAEVVAIDNLRRAAK